MRFKIIVEVEVQRVQGKFSSRDDISDRLTEAIQEAIDSADFTGLGADGDSEYEVTDSSVT